MVYSEHNLIKPCYIRRINPAKPVAKTKELLKSGFVLAVSLVPTEPTIDLTLYDCLSVVSRIY